MATSLREQAERTASRVLDDYMMSGALPGPFRRRLYDRYGAWPSWRQIKEEVRPWAQDFLAEIDKGSKPEKAGS